MYVVAMSANGAQNYTTSKQIEALIERSDVKAITTNQEGTKGTTIKLPDGVTATLWKVTSKETAGQWLSVSYTHLKQKICKGRLG